MGATLTIKYAGQSREYKLPPGQPFYIGRGDSTLSMRINHASISRIHARIESKSNRWYVTDMGSRNGTQLNGKDIEGETPLDSGDEIRIGKLKVIFATNASVAAIDADDERTLVEAGWNSDNFGVAKDVETEWISSKQSGLEWIEEEDTPVSDVDAEIVNSDDRKEEEDDFGLGNAGKDDLESQDTPDEAADREENMVTVDGLGGDSAPSSASPADVPRRRGLVFAAAGAAIFALVAAAGSAGYYFYLKPSSHVEEQAGIQNADENEPDSGARTAAPENGNEGDETAPAISPGNPVDTEAAPEDDPAADSALGEKAKKAPDKGMLKDTDIHVDLPEIDGVPVELPE